MKDLRPHLVASFFIAVVILFALVASVVGVRDVTLGFSPEKENFEVGESFTVNFQVNALVGINVIAANIEFSKDLLEIVSVSSENSILDLWVTEVNFSNSRGVINFEGGIIGDGFSGKGTVIDIRFRTKKEGDASVFINSATVLASDGEGTGVDVEKGSASYLIKNPDPVQTFPVFGSPSRESRDSDRSPLKKEYSRHDLNRDGKVDVFDAIYFMRHWLGPYDRRLDLNGNGRVGMGDFSILLSEIFD